MKRLILLIIILAPLKGVTQDLIWADRIGSTGNNYAFNVRLDTFSQHVYTTGRVKEPCTFGENSNPTSPPVIGDRDVYLTNHNQNGDLVWVKRFGGVLTDYGQSIEYDANHIYVFGYFSGQFYVDDDTLNSAGAEDLFVCKFNKDGDLIWAKSWGGLGKDLFLESHIVDDKIYATGYFEDSINFDGIDLINTIPTSFTFRTSSFLIEMDTSGLVNWGEKQESQRTVQPIDLKVKDGFIYMVGNCKGNSYFDGNLYTSVNTVWLDQFICKYDVNGSFYWTKLFGANLNDLFTQVEVGDSNIYATGFFNGVVSYGSDNYNVPVQSGIALQMDTAGVVQNSYLLNSSGNGDLDGLTFTEGRVFVGGYFYDSLFVGSDTVIAIGANDNIVVELDENFSPIDFFSFGGASNNQVRHMDSDNNSQVILGGSFRGTTDFQTTSFFAAANTYDGYVTPFCPKLYMDISLLDSTVCVGETMVIDNNTIGGIADLTDLPASGNIEFSNKDSIGISFDTAGNYSFELKFNSSCRSDSILISNLNVLDVPTVDLGADIVECDSIVVNLVAGGAYDSLNWSTGENTTSIVAPTSGTYWVDAFNMDSCMATDTVIVTLSDCSSLHENVLDFSAFYNGGFVYVDFPSDSYKQRYIYRFYGADGRLITEGRIESNEILLPNVSPGVYMFVINNSLSSKTFKFVIP